MDEAVWPWRGRLWCHLLADSTAELDAFAAGLELRPGWRQCRPGRPWRDHYDIPEAVRAQAIAPGAIALDRRQLVDLLRRRRAQTQ